MKRNFLALSAVVLAVAASSFTTKKAVDVYFIHQGGTQTLRSSYAEQQSPIPATNPGTTSLNWFKVADNDGTVSSTEFNASFSNYDMNGNNTLNDEAEIAGSLDKK